jgi:hypothetical protein
VGILFAIVFWIVVAFIVVMLIIGFGTALLGAIFGVNKHNRDKDSDSTYGDPGHHRRR